jgi:hypothetical protein
MTVHQKLVASIRLHSPYLAWAKEGLTPDEIKREILAALQPHFRNPSVLTDVPISILAHEAVTLRKIQSDPWASSMFTAILSEYREALAQDQAESISAVEAWDEAVAQAMSEFMSIYLMEVDKAALEMEELRLEVLHNVGGLLEACLQPQLKALLHLVRIRRSRKPRVGDIVSLKFGSVVEELHQTLRLPAIVAPPPWCLKLHHWRNIAQHHSAVIEGNRVVCRYRVGKTEHQISLTRDEFVSVPRVMQEVLGIVRAARSVFIGDNSLVLSSRHGPRPRPEIPFFQMAVGIATQGFDIVDLHISDDSAHLYVQDVTDQDPKLRCVHASQFVVPTWAHFPRREIRVTYIDKSGCKRLETTAAGSDCEQIAEEKLSFEELANRVIFRDFDRDAAARESQS